MPHKRLAIGIAGLGAVGLGVARRLQKGIPGLVLAGVAVRDRDKEGAVTLAKNVDWRGWQRRTILLPGEINPPVTLVALYAVPSLGTPPVHAAGTIRFRNPVAILPGTPAK